MSQFRSQKQAKEYLIGRIVAEAEQEGVVLSDVERKMLYFSETDWTLPGIMDVNAEFERDYDDAGYEEKIAGIVRNLLERATPEEQQTWDDAVLKLCDGDHYLLVLIDRGSGRRSGWFDLLIRILKDEPARNRGEMVWAIVLAIAFVLILVAAGLVRSYLR
jgi:hypothetical protein